MFNMKKPNTKSNNNSNLRGNWEWNSYQKPQFSSNEETIKSKLSTGNFDHFKIDEMMNPKLSIIEKLK